ncbi:LANO_0B04874g1_1 [Lachancea nothofagi CBS 11611]|uniref:LANO_0B04874g1_1 n=1 Tax=Lachancea nothofagi CBS 11611 TaxID=1266666 RepID=A0A1G4IY51_9SACH|nr:LANO_0B04874g1_1 [Lachancea nothofagi CBS 11611]
MGAKTGLFHSHGLLNKIAFTWNHLSPEKPSDDVWTDENTGVENSTLMGAPSLMLPNSLNRSGKFKRSLKKAKRLLNNGLGSPPARKTSATIRSNGSNDPVRFLSVFGRSHLNSELWLSKQDGVATLEQEKENSQPLIKKIEPKDSTTKRDPLKDLPIEVSEYLTAEEIENRDTHINVGEPKSKRISGELKLVFAMAITEFVQENDRWIQKLRMAQTSWDKSDAARSEHLRFLENLQNLLKYESGFLEEMSAKFEAVCEENEVLRGLE